MSNCCIFPFCEEEPTEETFDHQHVCDDHVGEHTKACAKNPCEACESASESEAEVGR